MFLHTARPRSLAYLLTKLSPLDIAHATEAYFTARPSESVAALMTRAIARMGNGERRQFGMALGLGTPDHDPFFDEAAPPLEDIASAIERSGERITEIALRFLRQNPRALAALDGGVLEAILSHAAALGMSTTEDAVPAQEIDDFDEPARLLESLTLTATDVVGTIGRPFIAIATAIASSARAFVRGVLAIPRAVLNGLLWLAQPFIRLYRAVIAFVRALASGIAAIPRLVMRLLALIVMPFVLGWRLLVAGARAARSAFTTAVRSIARIRAPRMQMPKIQMPQVRMPQVHFPQMRIAWATVGIAAGVIAFGAVASYALFALQHAVRHTTIVAAAATPQPTFAREHHVQHLAGPRPHAPEHAQRKRVIAAVAVPTPTIAPTVAPTQRAATPAPPNKRSRKPARSHVTPAPRHHTKSGRARPRTTVDVADIPAEVHVTRSVRPDSPLVQQARREVASYLASLKRGDHRDALVRLGLAPDAPDSNLTEAQALANGRFRIVDAAARDEGGAKVDVDIHAPGQHFFGVYTVSSLASGLQITSHTLIPVAGPGQVAGP